MTKNLALAAALLASAPAPAQETSAAAGPANEPKINQLIIYGEDRCKDSTEEEIVVCVRLPESERYRIPENLRELDRPQSQAWANRAAELTYVGRTGTGSCSTVGPGGYLGCLTEIIKTAASERQNSDSVNWNRLIEEARRERLGRIDEESEAIERELQNEP